MGVIANLANITGIVIEKETKNEAVKSFAQTLQSVEPALVSMIAIAVLLVMGLTTGVAGMSAGILVPVLLVVCSLVGATTLGIPLVTHLGKKIFPGIQDKIEPFQKWYAVAIKIMNIVFSAIDAISTLCLSASPLSFVFIIFPALLSGGFSLYGLANQLGMPLETVEPVTVT